MKKHLADIVSLLGILVIVFGTIYGTTQQVLRQSANDPQVQMAEDAARALNAGATPQGLMNGKIDMDKSLSPFLIVYDRNSGTPVAGSGYLDGKLPQVPRGVLWSADNKPYYLVTWQPRSDVRIASVTTNAGSYYVLAGRSLREVEKREEKVLMLSLAGGIASSALALTLVASRMRRGKKLSDLSNDTQTSKPTKHRR